MAYLELAIDMGTSYTSIYQKGMGLVLHEPSVVIAQSAHSAKGIKAVGQDAKKQIGKTAEDAVAVFPIAEGAITNPVMAQAMLEYFLGKITPNALVRPRMKALINIPCGLSQEERTIFENVVSDAGIKDAIMLEAPIAAAFGMNAPLTKAEPCMIVDIGGGTTDIGVLTLNGMIAGCSVGLGGNNIDIGLIDYLVENHGLKTGLLSAERLKMRIGSLYLNDTTTALVNGRDTETQSPRSLLLSSKDICGVMEYYYYKSLDVIESVIRMLPEEVGAEIGKTGVFLCGGASQTAGIDRAFHKYLKMDIKTVEEPNYATILGLGKLLADRSLLQDFIAE